MNIYNQRTLTSDKKVDDIFHTFGFSIPIMQGGKRVWPVKFKRYISENIDAGELSATQVAKKCKVSKSLVYQWRMQAKGKPVTTSDWRAKAVFAKVAVRGGPDYSTTLQPV